MALGGLLIIRAPLLHFYPGAVKGQEPVLIEALGAKLSVYAGPQIKLVGNEHTAWSCWQQVLPNVVATRHDPHGVGRYVQPS
jgi:hypothetical protein